MIASTKLKESTPLKLSELSSIGLEASRAATEKMLAHYKRMGLKVTSRMTLAPEGKNLKKRKAAP